MYAVFAASINLARRVNAKTFTILHLCAVAVTTLPFLYLQEILPLVWCFTTPVSTVVLVYASGLGRRHFCFSFVPRAGREALQVLTLLVCGIALFLVCTVGLGTVSYTGALWRSPWYVVADSTFVWIFIVGVSEEIIFRCGLLTLVADWFTGLSGHSVFSRQPRLAAVVIISLVFGLVHIFRGATLFFLSILASLLYGLAFCRRSNFIRSCDAAWHLEYSGAGEFFYCGFSLTDREAFLWPLQILVRATIVGLVTMGAAFFILFPDNSTPDKVAHFLSDHVNDGFQILAHLLVFAIAWRWRSWRPVLLDLSVATVVTAGRAAFQTLSHRPDRHPAFRRIRGLPQRACVSNFFAGLCAVAVLSEALVGLVWNGGSCHVVADTDECTHGAADRLQG